MKYVQLISYFMYCMNKYEKQIKTQNCYTHAQQLIIKLCNIRHM
jgi:hypothetical protein